MASHGYLLLPLSPVAGDPVVEHSRLLVQAVGEAESVVEAPKLRAEEVAAQNPSTSAREPAVYHRDPLRGWMVEAVLDQ